MSRHLKIILIVVFNIALDQISKFVVRAKMDYREEIEIIGEYFRLIYVENTGAFLGMGSDMNPTLKLIFLLILPALVLGYVVYYLFTNKDIDQLTLIGFSCIVGGGIANVFDRIVYGSVTDFFFIKITEVIKTGIFNFADLSVTTGMILLLISGFRNRKIQKTSSEN